jgi:hypothetical protein
LNGKKDKWASLMYVSIWHCVVSGEEGPVESQREGQPTARGAATLHRHRAETVSGTGASMLAAEPAHPQTDFCYYSNC